jgi:hypothetical protein
MERRPVLTLHPSRITPRCRRWSSCSEQNMARDVQAYYPKLDVAVEVALG